MLTNSVGFPTRLAFEHRELGKSEKKRFLVDRFHIRFVYRMRQSQSIGRDPLFFFSNLDGRTQFGPDSVLISVFFLYFNFVSKNANCSIFLFSISFLKSLEIFFFCDTCSLQAFPIMMMMIGLSFCHPSDWELVNQNRIGILFRLPIQIVQFENNTKHLFPVSVASCTEEVETERKKDIEQQDDHVIDYDWIVFTWKSILANLRFLFFSFLV